MIWDYVRNAHAFSSLRVTADSYRTVDVYSFNCKWTIFSWLQFVWRMLDNQTFAAWLVIVVTTFRIGASEVVIYGDLTALLNDTKVG